MIVEGMLVCSSFCVSLCMFTVSKALLMSSATVMVRAGGAILLNPFATVFLSVWSAIVVECCILYSCCMGMFNMFAAMYGSRHFSSVFAITKRRDMGLYEVPICMFLLGLGMGTVLANFYICGIMFLLRAVLSVLLRNAVPRGSMCFKCRMFSL